MGSFRRLLVLLVILAAAACSGQGSDPGPASSEDAGVRADSSASAADGGAPGDAAIGEGGAGQAEAGPSDAAASPETEAGAGEAGAIEESDLLSRADTASHHTEFPLHGVALFHNVNVYMEPNSRSERLGVLRRGTRVRLNRAVDGRACRGGRWHPVQPGGYVCSGRTMRIGEEPPHLAFSPTPARLDASTPYDYGRNRLDRAPLYRRPPTTAEYTAELERRRAELEARRAEAEARRVAAAAIADGGASVVEEEEEEEEEEEDQGEDPALGPIVTRLQRGFYVTVERIIIENGRRWVRTSGLNYVEAPAIFRRAVTDYQGAELGDEISLPIAIVRRDLRSRQINVKGRLSPGRTIERFTTLPILGTTKLGGAEYYSVGDGELVAAERVKRIDAIDPPPEVEVNERWIDVDLSEQTLVAYEGGRPVYATMISSGKQGHRTPVGSFRITSKHISCDMSDTTDGDEPYMIEDVPWTMYFHLAIALHGAFWHSRFGRERSHGCVNLAPADARWLFWWVGPDLPEGWHGVTSTEDNPGTRVYVRR